MKTGFTAVVTGANKGLGFALVRDLCGRLDSKARIYLTARDEAKGLDAVRRLEREGLHPRFFRLDLADELSIQALAAHIHSEHGGIDLLLQNGAYAAVPDRSGKEQVRQMIDTNNHGTIRLLEAFRPILNRHARVLVVASGFGTLRSLNPLLHSRFDTNRMSLAELAVEMDRYVEAVESDRAQAECWPDWINVASKVGQVAAMRIFARELLADPTVPEGVLVNAVCPGWLITDASRPYLANLPPEIKPKLPDAATDDVLFLGLLPAETREPYGELVQFRRVLPWQ